MRAGINLIPSIVMLFILVTISPQPLSAQAPESWPAVPKDDLLLSEDPSNPGTSAMILERSIYTDDAKRFETHWTRIKIFKEDGTSTADIQIPYDAKSTTLTDIAGRTIRPDGTVLEFNGLVYETTVAKYKGLRYQAKTFTLPGAQPGCIVEYRFTYHWKQNLPDEVRNPSHYIFAGSYAYPSTIWTIREKLFTRHASFVVKPLSQSRVRWVAVRFPQPEPTVQGDGTIKLELSNIAALPEEPAMPPPSFVDSTIHFFYAFGYGEDYWGEFGKEMGTTESTFTAPTKYLTDLANEIAPSVDAPEIRLRKIYARVQQLRFVSFEHSRTEKEVKREGLAENKNAEQALKRGYAFSHEINLVFLALARAAGFDAHIAMVSDRRRNQFHPRLPDLSQANASVVQVKLNGKLLFFDPATRYCPYGLLPWFETGTQGFVWDKFGGRLTEVPPQLAEKAVTERTADMILAPDGTIQGTVEILFKGVEALDWRIYAVLKDEAGRRKDIEDAIDELFPERAEVELQNVTGWEQSDEPLRVKCKITMPFFAASTGHRLIFPTSIFQMKRKPLISPRNRVHPVYFDHAYKTVDHVTIAIPPNYRVEGIPKDANSTEAQSYVYQFTRSFSDGSIHAERTLGVDSYYFTADTYRPFWAFLTKASIRDAENVVLRFEEHPK